MAENRVFLIKKHRINKVILPEIISISFNPKLTIFESVNTGYDHKKKANANLKKSINDV